MFYIIQVSFKAKEVVQDKRYSSKISETGNRNVLKQKTLGNILESQKIEMILFLFQKRLIGELKQFKITCVVIKIVQTVNKLGT